MQISAKVTVSGCSHLCSNPGHSHHGRAPADYTVQQECPFVSTEADENGCSVVRPVADTDIIDGGGGGGGAAAVAGSALCS